MNMVTIVLFYWKAHACSDFTESFHLLRSATTDVAIPQSELNNFTSKQ